MNENQNTDIISINEIERTVKQLLLKYNAASALLFGSYARGEASPQSDIDLIIFGGDKFNPTDVFAIAEELYIALGKDVDVYEIREIDNNTPFYENVMKTGVKIAA